MIIPEDRLSVYLDRKDYTCPRLEVDGYYISWNKVWGIKAEELPQLRRFIEDTLPHLDFLIRCANAPETIPEVKKQTQKLFGLSPVMTVVRDVEGKEFGIGGVQFILFITPKSNQDRGGIFIDREESIGLRNDEGYGSSMVSLRWSLGELLRGHPEDDPGI